MAEEGQTARIARPKGDGLELARGQIDPAEFALAGIQHIELAVMPTRRMRHGEAGANDLAALDIHDNAARDTCVPPAVCHIAPSDRRDISGPAISHCQPIEM